MALLRIRRNRIWEINLINFGENNEKFNNSREVGNWDETIEWTSTEWTSYKWSDRDRWERMDQCSPDQGQTNLTKLATSVLVTDVGDEMCWRQL